MIDWEIDTPENAVADDVVEGRIAFIEIEQNDIFPNEFRVFFNEQYQASCSSMSAAKSYCEKRTQN